MVIIIYVHQIVRVVASQTNMIIMVALLVWDVNLVTGNNKTINDISNDST